jgi:hypothetical protein
VLTVRKILAASFIAALALLIPTVAPASADPVASVFVGTATTGDTWFPASPFCPGIACSPGPVSWSFSSSTADVGVHGTSLFLNTGGSPNVSGSGQFYGWCGHSEANIGLGAGLTGSSTVNGVTISNVTWVSAGGTIVITGSAPGHTAGGAIVQARPIAANGTVPCLTVPANNFTVVGAAVIV